MNTKTIFTAIAYVITATLVGYHISGCATVFKGTREPVDFNSDPTGAEVYVNGSLMGKTPVTLKLESKIEYTIEFRKEGYDPKTYTITNHVGAGWIVLDILFGVVPVVVDAVTGAWYKLDEDAVNAILEAQ